MKFLWTTINVLNMEESIAFYSNLVGLELTSRFPAGPGKEIAFMGNKIEGETLVELICDTTIKEVRFEEFISIGFGVDSVVTMLDKVKSHKIPVHVGPIETPGAIFFLIKDPNGLNVQFFQKK